MTKLPEKASLEFLDLQAALAGRYSLEAELGRGGMGIVFLARDVPLDRMVALKLLPPAMARRPGLKERFLAEARTAARLSHPNIVPIFSVDEEDGFVFFVMAYIPGGTLGDHVRERGPLANTEAVKVIREVAWALAHAHMQGIVHRDVKPDNILLEAETGRAMITDFGIAILAEEAGEVSPSKILGTAEFMSPEHATGSEVDARSDLYSLASVGFYALSGRPPFQGPSPQSLLTRKIQESPPTTASVAPGVPSNVATALDRCLRRDPEKRLPGCKELADRLIPDLAEDRELPVPLRVFVKETREFESTMAWAGLALIFFAPPLLVSALTGSLGGVLGLGALLSGELAFLATRLGKVARRLLRSGFTLDEALRALGKDVERREEEFLFQVGKGSGWVDAGLKAGILGGFGLVVLSILGDILGFPFPSEVPAWALVTGLASTLAREVRKRRRRDVMGKRWLRFWKSKLGEWAFRLGGLRLERVAPSAGSLHRPTETVIGLAAERLFQELPPETRKPLEGLPGTVKDLEEDAQTLRTQLKELEAVLAKIGDDDPEGPHAQERIDLRERVRATRDRAEGKLREAVAALETIRLGLLRMHAGSGEVESLTLELESARELSRDMEYLLDAHVEVEGILKEEGDR